MGGNIFLKRSFGKRRWLFAFHSRMSCESGSGLSKRIFLLKGEQVPKHSSGDENLDWECGSRRGGGALSRPLPSPPTCSRLRAVHKASQAPWLSIAPTGARRLDAAAGTRRASTCCARSARRAGAGHLPPGWRRAGAAAAAAAGRAAAAAGGLRTREAAGAGGAPPFPRCHSDPRGLAPGPSADFRNQKAISSSPGKGTMRGQGREPRGANA